MKKLFDNDKLFAHFVEQVKDYAIFQIDVDGYVSSWNAGAQRIKEYTEEEIIGQHLEVLFPDDLREQGYAQRELEDARIYGEFKTENWRRKKSGSLFWANVLLTATYDEEGKHIGYIKIVRDLTKHREEEEKMLWKNQELIRLNTDLDNFVYTASHDLKSPIANLEGLVSLLEKEVRASATPRTNQVLDMINLSVKRFKVTINDLTEISKVQKDLDKDAYETFSIQDVYDDIMADLAHVSEGTGCRITTSFAAEELDFSRRNFRSILYNLVSNAIRYTNPHTPCDIAIQTYTQEQYFVLKVKDNGLGIEKKNLSNIFKMFKRYHDHIEGTGIGLYIVKRIIDNSDGQIDVESEEGLGTTFTIRLPLSVEKD
jgi:PAS domain S-box-containing protein